MIPKAKNIFRPATCLLLVVCLFSALATYDPSAGQRAEKDLATVRITPSFMGGGIAPATLDQPASFKFPDELFKDALILGSLSIDLTRTSVFFLYQFNDRLTQHLWQTTFAIRAPPCAKTTK